MLKRAFSSPGNDVRRAGAGADVRDLERRRLEELVALVPDARGELGQRRRNSVHRIVGQMRIGDVSLHAVHRQLAGERAAAADLDRCRRAHRCSGFADDAPVDLLAARLEHFHDAARAVDRGTFLVAGQQEGERAVVVADAGR